MFCSQSARFHTDVDVYPFLDLDDVMAAARKPHATAGATQFCIVVAVRNPEERLLRKVIDAVGAVQRDVGLEVACSLGLLTEEQAERLAAAGVRRYNHNLETCRAVFPQICTTHSYDDRVATARLAIEAGWSCAAVGSLGLGDVGATPRLRVQLAALDPCEVPINFPDPRRGTPPANQTLLSTAEALQAIALFRPVLLGRGCVWPGDESGSSENCSRWACFRGANALIVGTT